MRGGRCVLFAFHLPTATTNHHFELLHRQPDPVVTFLAITDGSSGALPHGYDKDSSLAAELHPNQNIIYVLASGNSNIGNLDYLPCSENFFPHGCFMEMHNYWFLCKLSVLHSINLYFAFFYFLHASHVKNKFSQWKSHAHAPPIWFSLWEFIWIFFRNSD